MPPKSRSKQVASAQKRKRRDEPDSEDEGYNTSSTEDDVQALDSDNLDDDDADTAKRGRKTKIKRKKNPSPTKPRKRKKKMASEEEESDLELKEGQEVVGKIVRAPKTGQGELQVFRQGVKLSGVPQFLRGRYPRILSTFLTNLRNQNATIGNGQFPSRLEPFPSAHQRYSRFKLNGTRVRNLSPHLNLSQTPMQNPCSDRPRKSGRLLSKCSRTTSRRQTHRSRICPRRT